MGFVDVVDSFKYLIIRFVVVNCPGTLRSLAEIVFYKISKFEAISQFHICRSLRRLYDKLMSQLISKYVIKQWDRDKNQADSNIVARKSGIVGTKSSRYDPQWSIQVYARHKTLNWIT